MDELKKDEILEEAEETAEEAVEETVEAPSEDAEPVAEEEIPEAEEIAEEKSELEAELEEIRNMFQKELDAQTNGTEMLIQELDEETAGSEEEEDFIPCDCCGENRRSADFGEDYPYCDSCREAMKRYPLRFSGFLTIIVSILLLVGTAYLSSSTIDNWIPSLEGLMLYSEGKLYSGMESAYSGLGSGEKDTVSMKLVKETIDAYVATGYYSDAVSLIETYFTETQLKMPWNKKYTKIITDSTVLEETYYTVSDIIEPVANGLEYDYDEIIASLDALKEVNPKEEGKSTVTEKYNEAFIEYYKYVVMSVNEKSLEEQLQQLKKVEEVGEGYEWVYLSNLCGIAARAGDEETVNRAFEQAIEINKEDTNAYIAKASYYRYLETPDADKILEICAEAAKNSYGSDLSYKQYEAIAYLIKGEGAMALEAIEEAITSGYTVQTCNLYALCGLYNGNTDIYKEMKTLLAGSGYEISPLVEKYKNDKITIAEIIADNGGDI